MNIWLRFARARLNYSASSYSSSTSFFNSIFDTAYKSRVVSYKMPKKRLRFIDRFIYSFNFTIIKIKLIELISWRKLRKYIKAAVAVDLEDE